jgi:hypothetical protein
MGWVQDTFDNVELQGLSRADFDAVWGQYMQLWRPTDVPGIAGRVDLDIANQ